MRNRYGVITVSGDLGPRQGGYAKAAGLSAHVIDRPNAHKVVATFRSEDRLKGSYTLGQDGALDAAEALAAEWNEDDDCRVRAFA